MWYFILDTDSDLLWNPTVWNIMYNILKSDIKPIGSLIVRRNEKYHTMKTVRLFREILFGS